MRRGELADDGAAWNIPGDRTKNGRPHVVPMPPITRDILATVKPIAGSAGLCSRRPAARRSAAGQS